MKLNHIRRQVSRMTVVLWMDDCYFCHTEHWTDQECNSQEEA